MDITTRCPPAPTGRHRGWRKPGADHKSRRQRHRWYPRHASRCCFLIGWSPQFARARSGDKIDSKLPRWRSRGGSAYATPQIRWRETSASRMFAILSARRRFGRLTGTSRNVAILPGPICAHMRLRIDNTSETCRRYPQFHLRNLRAATLRTYLSPNSGRWSVA
jgi:hypothetical protein